MGSAESLEEKEQGLGFSERKWWTETQSVLKLGKMTSEQSIETEV